MGFIIGFIVIIILVIFFSFVIAEGVKAIWRKLTDSDDY